MLFHEFFLKWSNRNNRNRNNRNRSNNRNNKMYEKLSKPKSAVNIFIFEQSKKLIEN